MMIDEVACRPRLNKGGGLDPFVAKPGVDLNREMGSGWINGVEGSGTR